MISTTSSHGRKRSRQQHQGEGGKRHKTLQAAGGGVFACFTLDGNDVNLHRRSAFSSKRKEEVKGIRRKGACLRCRLLKRACSGEDPCKTCLAAAKAAANSKALMWMECIRPSFQAINIFDNGVTMPNKARLSSITADLLNDDVYLDFHIPFELNVEAASSQLARWLTEEESGSAFSVVGVFSSSTNTNLLENALDPSLGRDLRLFVHLTTHLYTTEMHGGYQQYTDQEIQAVRDSVGNRLLSSLDPLLRPSEIEASEDKLAKLRSLFLLLLGTIVGMRYTCYEVFEEPRVYMTESESKQDALLRLLCHYLIYIGKVTGLLESSSNEKKLLQTWKTQWNKPAAFTWNPSRGLEMHYRIEPPATWIVSSSEDASLSNIDFDLSQFDDAALLTQDSDLLKCSACGAFWAFLDNEGLCQACNRNAQVPTEDSQPISCADDLEVTDITAFNIPDNRPTDFESLGAYGEPPIDRSSALFHAFSVTDQRTKFENETSPFQCACSGTIKDLETDPLCFGAPPALCGHLHGQYCDFLNNIGITRNQNKCWRCAPRNMLQKAREYMCARCMKHLQLPSPDAQLELCGAFQTSDSFGFDTGSILSENIADNLDQDGVRITSSSFSSADFADESLGTRYVLSDLPKETASKPKYLCPCCRQTSTEVLHLHPLLDTYPSLSCYRCSSLCTIPWCIGDCMNGSTTSKRGLI